MRTQKISIRISFYFSLTSLVLLLIFSYCITLSSIFSGIFASALLSLFISICNYMALRKYKIEMLVINAYRKTADSFSNLFNTKKDITLEDAQKVTNILNTRLYELYVDNHELLIGLFWFNKFKNNIKSLEKDIQNQIEKVSEIEFYIEFFENEAKEKTKQIYNDLDSIIDDNRIYIEFLKLCKTCNGEFRSIEEYDNDKRYKKACAQRYRNKLK